MPLQQHRLSQANSRRDMVVVVLAMLVGFFGSIYFEPFEVVNQFDRAHPDWHSDDAITGLVFGSISLIWFAKRRMTETLNGALLSATALDAQRYQALEHEARALAEVADELAQARDHALAADRLKSEFLDNLSHEFRTPLNGVIGLSELMMAGPRDQLGDVYGEYLANILSSGRRLLALVDDLFEVAVIKAGQAAPHLEAIDLTTLLGTCSTLVSSQATRADLEVALDVPPTLPAMADKSMLTRLVAHLLLNAIKYTPRGGQIGLSAKLDAEDASGVEIVVSDSGLGMTREEVEIALLPFRQVDGGPSRRQEGVGLGLPLAKSIAELHGGSLSVDSMPKHGTTVRVRLPILMTAAAA
jgi:two-component system, cell cycle sensor histidine kinase PleC